MQLCMGVQTPQNDPVAAFLTEEFVGLLKYLNADRQTAANGRLLWRCELCGLETMGMGIRSHQNKHCSEYGYLVDRENAIGRKPYLERIAQHQGAIDTVVNAVHQSSRIEMKNYGQSARVFDLFEREHIRPELWLYVGSQLQFSFSNRARSRFEEEIIHRLRLLGAEPLREPPMIAKTFENILHLLALDSTVREMPPNNRMHLTGYSGLCPLPPAGDAGRYASQEEL